MSHFKAKFYKIEGEAIIWNVHFFKVLTKRKLMALRQGRGME